MCFNSRTLGRVRLSSQEKDVSRRGFQFTHPGKGATPSCRGDHCTIRVSIHAPWEGCDRSPPLRPPGASRFQFTHPGKGATRSAPYKSCYHYGFNSRTLGRVRHLVLLVHIKPQMFQFTHPGKGATRNVGKGQEDQWVSIHAPWEGCDYDFAGGVPKKVRFNSRTLGRVRPIEIVYIIVLRLCFNSRTLGRVRLMIAQRLHTFATFQFTHPGKGATGSSRTLRGTQTSFNSRTLGRVRLEHSSLSGYIFCFNSRTLGRVRLSLTMFCPLCVMFQFTHPGKGATPHVCAV